MKTLSQTDRDIHLDSAGNIAIAVEAEGLRQKLETRLRLYLEEWFLDTSAGVPYIQRILGRGEAQVTQGISSGAITRIFDAEVLKEPEVVSIIQSEGNFDASTRKFTYTAEVDTIYDSVLTLEVS